MKFDDFKKTREKYLFGTNDQKLVKYRYQLQNAKNFTPFKKNKFGPYPKVLREKIGRNERFKIIYKNKIPFLRVDSEDMEMKNYKYINHKNDNWNIELFFKRLSKESAKKYC